MPKLLFYRQARRDGGVRTGLEIDGEVILSRFEEGTTDTDPAIVWYVDVTCAGSRVPRQADAARQWLLRQAPAISRLLNNLADTVPAGSDPGEWPLRKSSSLPGGLKITVACTAVRRLEARQLADILRDLAANWRHYVDSLAALSAA